MYAKTIARKGTLAGGMLACWAMQLSPVAADERLACQNFSWPLQEEIVLMQQVAAPIESAATLPAIPPTAIELVLKPTASAELPFKSGIKAKALATQSHSGWLHFGSLPGAGTYNISISLDGWIDAIQDGTLLESTGFTGSRDCSLLRKSVRYQAVSQPLTIQVSGVGADKIKLTVRRVE